MSVSLHSSFLECSSDDEYPQRQGQRCVNNKNAPGRTQDRPTAATKNTTAPTKIGEENQDTLLTPPAASTMPRESRDERERIIKRATPLLFSRSAIIQIISSET